MSEAFEIGRSLGQYFVPMMVLLAGIYHGWKYVSKKLEEKDEDNNIP